MRARVYVCAHTHARAVTSSRGDISTLDRDETNVGRELGAIRHDLNVVWARAPRRMHRIKGSSAARRQRPPRARGHYEDYGRQLAAANSPPRIRQLTYSRDDGGFGSGRVSAAVRRRRRWIGGGVVGLHGAQTLRQKLPPNFVPGI